MPTIFIASSTSSLKEAKAIKTALSGIADVTIWNEGVFGLSSYFLEVLEGVAKEFDFGIFLMGADDFRQKNKGSVISEVPRDNVVFECGLFIGSLGRKRSFIVIPKNAKKLELPTDLSGLVFASYDVDTAGNMNFVTTCEEILRAMTSFEKTGDDHLHILGKMPTTIEPEPGVTRMPRDQFSVIHHKGRLAPIYTGNFLRGALHDICITGLSLRSFIDYFDARPREEIKEPIIEALDRGVTIDFIFQNPQSYYAKYLVREGENKRLLDQIKQSIKRALQLRAEFEKETGGKTFSLKLYSGFPFGQMKRVDAKSLDARILGYHYLTLNQRPRIPYFEIRKKTNPVLFSEYSDAMDEILKGSTNI